MLAARPGQWLGEHVRDDARPVWPVRPAWRSLGEATAARAQAGILANDLDGADGEAVLSNVIDIDALRVARKSSYVRAAGECRHMHITLDDNGDIVKCDDCGMQLSPYWALGHFVEHYQRAIAKLTRGENELRNAQEQGISLLAARRVERAWRSRTMVPCCPHCGEGVGPKDGFGSTQINKAIYERRRAAKRGEA
ncbi:hypothetical protein BCAR13_110102 [Paraburkholderia caribensis]|nr:hypothetical protein BCAR13_110102 [Paraburkholderia caribensis]